MGAEKIEVAGVFPQKGAAKNGGISERERRLKSLPALCGSKAAKERMGSACTSSAIQDDKPGT